MNKTLLVPLVGEIRKCRRKENDSYQSLWSYVPIANSVGQIVNRVIQMETISILIITINMQISYIQIFPLQ